MNKESGPGGGARHPQAKPGTPELIAHEEEARVGKRWEGTGYARVRREVDRETVSLDVPRQRDELVSERVPAAENDSGKIETLPDGSLSIPLYEEELIITRRTVLRERVIIRKETVTDFERVEAELRRERVSFDADGAPDDQVE